MADTDLWLCELVADACDLIERHCGLPYADDRVIADAEILRAELAAGAADARDDAVADDAAGACAQLEEFVASLQARPVLRAG